MTGILAELNKRNVTRVAVTYGVTGWLLAQVAGTLEEALSLPEWFDSMVVVVLIIGFPLAAIFAWVYELTPDGLVKATELHGENPASPHTARRLDIATIAAVVLLLGGTVLEPYIRGAITPPIDATTAAAPIPVVPAPVSEPSEADAAARLSSVPAASIAVLPFTDMSPEQDQEYFSDGLTEELLNVFTRVPGLKVAGRTSSFAFKGRNEDLVQIAKTLRVAHVLEGSVRKAGDTIRITAQLIKADTGFHLWSKTYDRTLVDIFAIQDEISGEIMRELSELLIGATPNLAVERTSSLGAYDLYLLAISKIDTYETAKIEEAIVHLDEAIALDPTYAKAWFSRASAEMLASDHPGAYGTRPYEQAADQAREFLDRGFALDPESPRGKAVLGLSYYLDRDFEQAVQLLREAQVLEPGKSPNNLGVAEEALGNYRLALAHYRKSVEIDPLSPSSQRNYVNQLFDFGRYQEAQAALEAWGEIVGDESRQSYLRVKNNHLGLTGEFAASVEGLREATAEFPTDIPLRGALFQAYMALGLSEEAAALDLFYAPAARMADDPEGTIGFMRDMIEKYPERRFIASRLLDQYVNLNRWDDAIALLPSTTEEASIENCEQQEPPSFGALYTLYQHQVETEKLRALNACRRLLIADLEEKGLANLAFQWKVRALADQGSYDDAVTLVRTAFPSSRVWYGPFAGVMGLGRYRDRSEQIMALETDVIAHINEQRALLGYGPIERI